MPQVPSVEFERDPSFVPSIARAGLRVAPRDEPPGTFVAIEIAVLVFVVALAMVAIIVIGTDDGADRPSPVATVRPASDPSARPSPTRPARVDSPETRLSR